MSSCLSIRISIFTMLALVVMLSVSGCSWLEPEPESYEQYMAAKHLYDNEDYQQAAVAYRAWLADYHDKQDLARPFVLYQLGECNRLMRNYEKAVTAYSKVIELHAGSADKSVKDLVALARLRLDDIKPKAGRTPEPVPPAAKTSGD
jgi:TolA-binding protein